MRTIEHWIGGHSSAGASTRTADVWNPATGQVQARVLLAESADVDAAVQTAKKAFDSWLEVSITRRARIMFAFRELIERNLDELAEIVSDEHGKILSDAGARSSAGMEVVEFACGIPQLLKGEYSEQVSNERRRVLIPPAARRRAPASRRSTSRRWCRCGCIRIAIATGNTFVLKPSERDPSASNFIAELYAEAGLPDGVFNVVHGDKVAVDAILDHPDIAAVSFVGSTPIAKYVHERATANGKRVQALGGAKNHAVVLPDADMDFAADQHQRGRLRLGRRALHGDLGRGRGRRGRRRCWSASCANKARGGQGRPGQR